MAEGRGTFLAVGAHPDDETLARGGAQVQIRPLA